MPDSAAVPPRRPRRERFRDRRLRDRRLRDRRLRDRRLRDPPLEETSPPLEETSPPLAADDAPSFFERVWAVVAQIPAGRVTTYGAIAERVGSRSAARTVGWALKAAVGSGLPCHRVVNRYGALTGPPPLPRPARHGGAPAQRGHRVHGRRPRRPRPPFLDARRRGLRLGVLWYVGAAVLRHLAMTPHHANAATTPTLQPRQRCNTPQPSPLGDGVEGVPKAGGTRRGAQAASCTVTGAVGDEGPPRPSPSRCGGRRSSAPRRPAGRPARRRW